MRNVLIGPDGRFVVRGNDWAVLENARPPEPPEISVVIPYYQAQAQLDLVLAALDLQSHPASRLQVIVADDGSATPPQAPAGVTVVRQEDRGFRAAAARNLGAAVAEGEMLCFLDADTIPEPGYLGALSALPTVLPDAVVVGRRRHADLTGWTPDRLRAWFDGGPAPTELTEPGWLRDAYAQSDNLLTVDDRSYRYLISAVLGLTRDLFVEVGGFDESFTRYGGEDWELGHRLFTAGAVLAHRPEATAWHHGPDWAGRNDDPVAARAQKAAEARALARLLPDPASRGPGTWQYPDLVVTIERGDEDAVWACARSVLDSALDVQIWTPHAGLAGLDLRLHPGAPPADVLARCRTQVALSGPVRLPPGALEALVDQVRPGGVGRVTAAICDVAIDVVATRARRRADRWASAFPGDLLETLFGHSTSQALR